MYSNAVNAIYDILVAANATGQALDYFTGVDFGEAEERVKTLERPFLVVMLDDPAIEEDWVAAKDRRGGAFRVLVVVTAQRLQDRPYGVKGDADQRGILTMVEDVMNQLDTDRDTILAADPTKLTDMNLAMRGPRIPGQGTLEATIVVSIRPRFTAANR